MSTPLERIILALQLEKKRLEHEFKIELPKIIGIAREHGDLSENAEYHAARERHGLVRARIGQIDGQLARLKSIDLKQIARDRIGLYSRVTLFEIETENELVYQLVTSEEADLDAGLVSISSPIGRGLTGRQVGDAVTIQVPAGVREFEVTTVKTLHDLANEPGEEE